MGIVIHVNFGIKRTETVQNDTPATVTQRFNVVPEVFTLKTANLALQTLKATTKRAQAKMRPLIDRLDVTHNDAAAEVLEGQINDLIIAWQNRVQALGAKATGLWMVVFDSGSGYFCWKFGESQIEFQHGYQEGYSKRVPVKTIKPKHKRNKA